ncbi:GlsB/YeaQ/YmgE family stress response membrane protein [Ligilactobacillus faecis]|uniref:GlsB/YeaQ/YmgE family stress response membrane protein n=1 Tax=Ligilactobacillus faecis TaxID=762833 RepID=UPI00246948C1|nr:GlsB/YeaQ/YmgE family stress response membrane protein [Ligilactobacillus faecis]WGN88777.1 GlsB/YeaQ/YmgE family stress response membrane protein [Ligilactobacillus faecis]
MLHWLWVLLVGAVIGALAGAVTKQGDRMGCLYNILAGLIGSAIGEALLGSWGPQVAGMALVPSLVGAIILVAVVSWISSQR